MESAFGQVAEQEAFFKYFGQVPMLLCSVLYWNRLGEKVKNMTNESNFKKHLLQRFLNVNASRKHLSISRTF